MEFKRLRGIAMCKTNLDTERNFNRRLLRVTATEGFLSDMDILSYRGDVWMKISYEESRKQRENSTNLFCFSILFFLLRLSSLKR